MKKRVIAVLTAVLMTASLAGSEVVSCLMIM